MSVSECSANVRFPASHYTPGQNQLLAIGRIRSRIANLQLVDDLQHLGQFVPGIDKHFSCQDIFSAGHKKQSFKDFVGMAHELDQVFAIRAVLALKPAVSKQIGLNRAGAFLSLRQCAIPSVISTVHRR